jgi:hypothetical protein
MQIDFPRQFQEVMTQLLLKTNCALDQLIRIFVTHVKKLYVNVPATKLGIVCAVGCLQFCVLTCMHAYLGQRQL